MDILAVLQRAGAGRVLVDLEDAIKIASREVVETGNPATVTLSLKVSVPERGDVMATIDGVVGRSVPKKSPKGGYFYVVNGDLYEEDPRQPQLEGLRTIDTRTGEIREANAPERVERAIL